MEPFCDLLWADLVRIGINKAHDCVFPGLITRKNVQFPFLLDIRPEQVEILNSNREPLSTLKQISYRWLIIMRCGSNTFINVPKIVILTYIFSTFKIILISIVSVK